MIRSVLPLVLIGISITGFFTFTSPTYSEISALNEKISSYEKALENATEIRKERDKLVNISNAIDLTNLEKLKKLLPDSIDNIRLILEIEGLARPYGMILRDVQYATEKTAEAAAPQAGMVSAEATKNYGEWDLGFSTQGTYDNFIKFIRDLESNLRVVDIVSVDFSSETGTGINPNSNQAQAYKYTFKIRTYWLKN